MFLSKFSAQAIVDEVGSVISTDINLMDEKGRIIASTVPNRVGKIHVGAVKILNGNLSELFIDQEDKEKNVKPGLNLPLNVEGKAVGVVGLTGRFDQVSQIGQIVKRMIEILIKDQLDKQQNQRNAQIRDKFFETLLSSDTDLALTPDLVTASNLIGFDFSHPKSLILYERSSLNHSNNIDFTDETEIDFVRFWKHFSTNTQITVYRREHQWVVFFPGNDTSNIQSFCNEVIEAAKKDFGISLHAGVALADHTLPGYASAYYRAQLALKAGKNHSVQTVFFDMENILIFLQNIDKTLKKQFMNAVFNGIDKINLEAYRELIKVYIETNGSLKRCAEYLFIHPNTLQYRIKKLTDITGLDIRQATQSLKLYLAMLCYEDLAESGKETPASSSEKPNELLA